jgi:hypothetical protein
MEATQLPAPLETLRAVLEERGFWLAEQEHREDSFGDTFLVLVRRGLSVRIVRDRGQWSVEVSGPGGDQWFSPMVWRTYLDGDAGDVATPALDEQCQLVSKRLDEMQAAAESDAALGERLLESRALRAQIRRGLRG